MEKKNIVMINGRGYDPLSGLPVESKATQKTSTKKPVAATVIHSAPQKSQTLHRRSTKKPVTKRMMEPVHAVHRSMDIARSKSISRFAAHPITKPTKAHVSHTDDIGPVLHPSVVRAHAAQVARQTPTTVVAPKTSQEIKNEAITEALEKKTPTSPKKTSFIKRHRKFFNIFTVVIVVLVVGGYITYVNLPNLSVHIAAAQAGINATYPEYHPDGYSVSGPVTYTNGSVTINFAANDGSGRFVIKQTKSTWDSSALENQVNATSNGQFITTEAQGLTIYTYGSDASWINGGILYTIKTSGNTILSGDQVRQIAISM
jgi:hypothetical protein